MIAMDTWWLVSFVLWIAAFVGWVMAFHFDRIDQLNYWIAAMVVSALAMFVLRFFAM